MIDTSPPGSWASILPYCTQIKVQEYDPFAARLERNLAARRAVKKEPNPHKRGHLTRKINSEAKNGTVCRTFRAKVEGNELSQACFPFLRLG